MNNLDEEQLEDLIDEATDLLWKKRGGIGFIESYIIHGRGQTKEYVFLDLKDLNPDQDKQMIEEFSERIAKAFGDRCLKSSAKFDITPNFIKRGFIGVLSPRPHFGSISKDEIIALSAKEDEAIEEYISDIIHFGFHKFQLDDYI